MDQYLEHLVTIRKDGRTVGLLVAVWVMMALFCAAGYFILPLPFNLIIMGGAVYCGIYLTKAANVEFEYIFTNGEIDVDMITAKSRRKRMITFDCKNIESVAPYVLGEQKDDAKYQKNSVYCNRADTEVFTLVLAAQKEGKTRITLQIPAKLQEKMLPYMDKLLARTAFKAQ